MPPIVVQARFSGAARRMGVRGYTGSVMAGASTPHLAPRARLELLLSGLDIVLGR